MGFARSNRDFADAKAEGVRAEWALTDLLAEGAGWTVQPNQANWDITAEGSAAKAYGPDGPIQLPDLEVIAPFRMGVEVKSKVPRQKDGSFGWDATAFRHAERWQEICSAPVIYAIRDRTIAPLPPNRGQPDNLAAWRCASLNMLRECEPERLRRPAETWDGDRQPKETWFWPADIFWPLSDLLEGRCFVGSALLRPKPSWGVSRIL